MSTSFSSSFDGLDSMLGRRTLLLLWPSSFKAAAACLAPFDPGLCGAGNGISFGAFKKNGSV